MTKEKERYYYRCESTSEIGKKFRKLLNDCQKAEKAQMEFGRKCGAESVVPVDSAFEGGVIGVLFKDDEKVNRTVWTEIVKDEKDGKIIWRPNCEQRQGAIIAKSESYRPSNTATRIYSYQQVGWLMVKHLHTASEWYQKARLFLSGKDLTGDWDEDEQIVGKLLSGKKFIPYTELYREDTKKPIREMSKLQREAIDLERQRMLLPVVTPQQVFAMLKANLMADAKEGQKYVVVKPETPTFWEYDGYWYIGCAFPCRAEGLEEISGEAYVSKRTDLMRVMRDMEAMAN